MDNYEDEECGIWPFLLALGVFWIGLAGVVYWVLV